MSQAEQERLEISYALDELSVSLVFRVPSDGEEFPALACAAVRSDPELPDPLARTAAAALPLLRKAHAELSLNLFHTYLASRNGGAARDSHPPRGKRPRRAA